MRGAGLAELLEFIVTSAEVGYRKPHPRAFKAALAHWPDIRPDEIAMVGDRLDADIAGAKRAGLFAVWMRHQPAKGEDRQERPWGPDAPDAVIRRLGDLPKTLSRLKRRDA